MRAPIIQNITALLFSAATAACQVDDRNPLQQQGKRLSVANTGDYAVLVDCRVPTAASEPVELQLLLNGDAFDIHAVSAFGSFFSLTAHRPSLSVRAENGATNAVSELIEFSPEGVEPVPVLANPRLEIDLGGGGALLYADGSNETRLLCDFEPSDLLSSLGLMLIDVTDLNASSIERVAFDIDDTLLFTTPTFTRGFATGGTPQPSDTVFWTHINGCDHGCAQETTTLPDGSTKQLPANAASTPKTKALELIAWHQAHGHEVYAITARPDINGAPLRAFVEAELGIAAANVYFEPDVDQPGNPKGKTDRIESLVLDIFYGDSDSDISDTLSVTSKTVVPIRFLRSPRSSNRKGEKLNKYHPGYYWEYIMTDSYE